MLLAAELDYPVSIALFDFFPVALSFLGGLQLAKWVGRRQASLRQIAVIGTVISTLGGLTKAVWKLIVSLDGPDIDWLEGTLFFGLGPGLALLAWAVISHDYLETGKAAPQASRHPALVPGLISLVAMTVAVILGFTKDWQKPYTIPILALTTLASASIVVVCVKASRRRSLPIPAVGFIVQFVGALALVRLQRLEPQTIKLQWIEESINTIAQGSYAWAATKLRKHTS
jgi:hypothetical protein